MTLLALKPLPLVLLPDLFARLSTVITGGSVKIFSARESEGDTGVGRARGRREYVGTKCVYSYVWRPEVRRLPQFLSILNFETRSLTRTWNMQARLVGIESSRFPQC